MNISRVMIDGVTGKLYVPVETIKRGKPYLRKEWVNLFICPECKNIFAKSIYRDAGGYCSNKCQTQKDNHPRWKD